jgi:hypothetical protein
LLAIANLERSHKEKVQTFVVALRNRELFFVYFMKTPIVLRNASGIFECEILCGTTLSIENI